MPALLQLLRADPDFPRIRLALLLTLSAVASGGFLIALNLAVEQMVAGQASPQDGLILLLLLSLSVITQYYALSQMGVSLEDAILKKRLLLAARLRYADPGYIEDIVDAPSRAILVKDSQIISQALLPAIRLIRSLAVLVFILIYLVALSPVFSVVVLVSLIAYLYVEKRLIQPRLALQLRTTWASHQTFFHYVQDFLANMRTIRQYRDASDEALNHYNHLAANMSQEKRVINQVVVSEFTFGYALFHFMLLLLLVFIPGLTGGWGADTTKLLLTTVFLMAELLPLPGHFPALARANAAIEEMERLEGVIKKSPHFESPGRMTQEGMSDFSSLTLSDLHFAYAVPEGVTPFGLGPLNLGIRAGDWLCLTGSSGSGKSTLIRILAGLQTGYSGTYSIDGQPLEPDHYPLMRELFAVVWSQEQPVQRLSCEDPRQMPGWLDKFDLTGKLRHLNGQWVVPVPLSTAENKRVLLLKAILEDRPVLLVDDVLGDQDEAFRERLCLDIFPALKKQGKTLVIVSRDASCLELADRVLTLHQGRLTE
jgi:putative ATP-binding cassette transporter